MHDVEPSKCSYRKWYAFFAVVKKRQDVLNNNCWGDDLDVRLMAIGLKRVIVVITALLDGSTYARRYVLNHPK